jgi:hypothetical protein
MITGSCSFTQHSVEFYIIFDYRYSPCFVDNTSSLNDTSAENVRIGCVSGLKDQKIHIANTTQITYYFRKLVTTIVTY